MDRMIEMKVSFDTDYAQAKEDTKVWAALALPERQEAGRPRPARDGGRWPRRPSPTRTRAGSSRPTPTSTSSRSRPYIGWGFNHLVFHFPGEAQVEAIDRYAEQILPRLRSRFG